MRTYDDWKATEPEYNADGLTPEEQALEEHLAEIEEQDAHRASVPFRAIASPEEMGAIWPREVKRCGTCSGSGCVTLRDYGPANCGTCGGTGTR